MKKVTLSELATRFNTTVWVKDNLQRIYLNNEGWNTKKMSTKTFIYEKDGEFVVSCRIECPGQSSNWIKSQEEQVKAEVSAKIEDYVNRILDPSINAKEAEEAAAEDAMIEAQRLERETKAAEAAKEAKAQLERAAATFAAGGEKYKHAQFGIGVLVSEDEQTITIAFQGAGEKKMLKKFAQLTKVA